MGSYIENWEEHIDEFEGKIDLSPSKDKIVRKIMDTIPKDRFVTANWLADRLDASKKRIALLISTHTSLAIERRNKDQEGHKIFEYRRRC